MTWCGAAGQGRAGPGKAGQGTTSATWQGQAGQGRAWLGGVRWGLAGQGISATTFVLAVAVVILADQVAGPWTAPLAVAVLAAGRVATLTRRHRTRRVA